MTKILVLGAGGMLGSMVLRVLGRNPELEVQGTARRGAGAALRSADDRGGGDLLHFDASRDPLEDLLSTGEYKWIVNAIGVIDSRIAARDPGSVARAIDVNAAFPHRLAAAVGAGQGVIQIATDGVFSGLAGPYAEPDLHDASDAYGKSKSLGEVAAPGFLNLRCSVIGPERSPPVSLLGWLLSQPPGAHLTGYTNHSWNGVTTWHFARLCEGVIAGRVGDLPSPLHVVPGDVVSKARLLELALAAFGRGDIELTHEAAERAIDRTLSTAHPEANRRLWEAAGYPDPPEIAVMLDELASVERHTTVGSR